MRIFRNRFGKNDVNNKQPPAVFYSNKMAGGYVYLTFPTKPRIKLMKKILSTSLFLILFASCSQDQTPKSLNKDYMIGIWGIEENSIQIQGIAIATIYDLAGVPQAARPDWNTFRIDFQQDGTYQIQNVDLIGLANSGVWSVDNELLILNPGEVKIQGEVLNSNRLTISYRFNTMGTPFNSLGSEATVAGTLFRK